MSLDNTLGGRSQQWAVSGSLLFFACKFNSLWFAIMDECGQACPAKHVNLC